MQVLKNQVPREAEINDLEEVTKSQPLAKESSEPHLNQALPLPISIERHAMIFIDLQIRYTTLHDTTIHYTTL